jgi:hypothetical protein
MSRPTPSKPANRRTVQNRASKGVMDIRSPESGVEEVSDMR